MSAVVFRYAVANRVTVSGMFGTGPKSIKVTMAQATKTIKPG